MNLKEMLLERAHELDEIAAATESSVARSQLADIAQTYRDLAEMGLKLHLSGPKKSKARYRGARRRTKCDARQEQ